MVQNLSERWEDVIEQNGQYNIDQKTAFCILSTIEIRYEIRQDLVSNLIFVLLAGRRFHTKSFLPARETGDVHDFAEKKTNKQGICVLMETP